MKRVFYLIAVVFATVVVATAQDRAITGTITDNDGSAIAGAIVKVKGTKTGTFSRSNGGYTVKASTGSVLVFSFIGKKTQEVTVGESSTINVRLSGDGSKESEVVVTAIGLNRSKKSLGYSTQEVGAEQITNSRESNIVNSLASRVAGVQVNNSTGVPGASSFIRIRGSSSLTGNNQPLFVIDGIPIDNSQLASEATQGSVAYSNRAMDLDPNSIESMNILKGPAATALYGIRAAGGAVIITTKKGRPNEDGKVNINVNASWAFDEVNKLPELQNKWSQGAGGRYAFSSGASRSWGASIDTLYYDGNVNSRHDRRGSIVGASAAPSGASKVTAIDPYASFFKTGMTQNQSVTMSGGSSAANYLVSFANLTSEGVVPNSEWSRRNVKVSSSAAVAKNVTASANINYVNSGGVRIQQGSNISGVMLALLRTPPTFDNANGLSGTDALAKNSAAYRYSDGTQRTYRNGAGYDNPFWTVNENIFEDNVNRLFGNAQIDWSILPELSLMYRIGIDYYNDSRIQTYAKGAKAYPSGRMFTDDNTLSDITSDLILTYNVDLTDDIHLQALVGQNLYSNNFNFNYVQADGVGNPDAARDPNNYAGTTVSQGLSRKRTMAYYTDLRFDYQNSLFFNFTGRNEWSTTLPEANNSFFYPSVSVAAVLTELLPDLKSDELTFVKLRANYATVGKDAPIFGTATGFGRASYSDGWTNGVTFPFGGLIGYTRGDNLASTNLRPEQTTSTEFGLDIALFDNRVSLDLTYYNQMSEDQIFSVPIANSSGYSTQLMNAGAISNNGIEAVLNLGIVRSNDFNWDMSVNFTKNNIKVERLADGVDNIGLGGFVGSSVRAVAGQPYGSIFGFGWERSSDGKILIDNDTNSADYGYPIMNYEEQAFGSANPDWMMGIRNTFTWKGITLSAQLDIRQGGVMWNGTRGALYFFGTHKETENRTGTKVFEGVLASDGTTPNNIEVPYGEGWLSLNNGNGFYGSNTEDFVEDASWVRLRELTLSYAIPSSIMESTPFSGLTVTFTGRNLWLQTAYTGVDPETSLQGASNAQGLDYFNMPSTKSYVMAFSLNF
jgi:TonB-linked SusC/RagA family outer membrane protein